VRFVHLRDQVAPGSSSVVSRLKSFCLRLGGRVIKMPFPNEFGCEVNPRAVLRNFDEFKSIAKELRGSGVARANFGSDDSYFYINPEDGEVSFVLTKEFTPIGEAIEDLASEVKHEWYDYMRKHGLEPEFDFIPDYSWGTSGDARHQYIDLVAETPYPNMDLLRDIAEAMLEFKKKLEEKIERYGAVETSKYRR